MTSVFPLQDANVMVSMMTSTLPLQDANIMISMMIVAFQAEGMRSASASPILGIKSRKLLITTIGLVPLLVVPQI
jgi:hypothetical protein